MDVDLDWEDKNQTRRGWRDKSGKYPDDMNKYVGKTYFHPKTGHLYQVVGIVFQSEDEAWMLAYRRVNDVGPVCTHRPEDFFREGRFLEVKK